MPTPILQVAHQGEQLLHLIFIKRRGRLGQNQHLAFHVHGTRDGNHLLHGQRTGGQGLGGPCRNVQLFEDVRRPFSERTPLDDAIPAPPDEHVFRNGKVRAQGDFLIHRADAQLLGILRRFDRDFLLMARKVDFTGILGIHPVSTLTRVDLPAPFSPIRAWISPFFREKST